MESNNASDQHPPLNRVDWYNYRRRLSRKIKVGDLTLGGDAPIRIQSMTTADTLDVSKTVDESVRMIQAGSELVRITAPSRKEAEALHSISEELKTMGHHVPLVADIHFTPNAAEIAADYVEKIRVNPGNYADKKKFEEIEYTASPTPKNSNAFGPASPHWSSNAKPSVARCALERTTVRFLTAS